MVSQEDFQQWLQQNFQSVLKDYYTFLRFPTISSEQEHDGNMLNCAMWLKEYLEKLSMTVEIWESSGPPVVFGQLKAPEDDRPTLLIYHHYDVQPVDPVEEWLTPPFEPTLKDSRVYARGASDNKGQCMCTIAALQAYLKYAQELNFHIQLLIEGEEEIGSPHLTEVLQAHRQKIRADYILIPDVHIPSLDMPTITVGMRGVLSLDVNVQTSPCDLHSGLYGGVAQNPIRVLASALSKMWDERGHIAIEGFYDRAVSRSVPSKFSTEEEKKLIDTRHCLPLLEEGYSPLQANWFRPTIEINGIWGGYRGEGTKTIIPSAAGAKLSCRIVPDQDPKEIARLVENFLKKNLPAKAKVSIKFHGGKIAYHAQTDSIIVKVAKKAYESTFAKECKEVYMGGSIPIASDLVSCCGGQLAFVGVALPEDGIHAPNEHFTLEQFTMGLLTMGMVFTNLQMQIDQ